MGRPFAIYGMPQITVNPDRSVEFLDNADRLLLAKLNLIV